MPASKTVAPTAPRVTPSGRLLAGGLLLAACVTFALAAARYVPSPLRFDESEWPPQAEGVLRHGTPMIAAADSLRLAPALRAPVPVEYGMWHPPLFLYTIAFARGTFGPGTVIVRLVALAWGALAIWLAWRVTAACLPREPLLRAVPIAVAVLSPLVVEGLFYIDIDNTAMAAAVFAVALAHVRLSPHRAWRRRVVLGLLLTCALWTKLTTPFLMLGAIVADTALRHGVKRAIVDGAVISTTGVVLFAVTYLAYCQVLEYPASFMFDISYVSKRGMYSSVQPFARILHAAWWNLAWVSPPLVLAGGWTAARRIRRWVRDRRVEDTDVLLIFAVMTFGTYVLVGGMIGKYTMPAALALAMVVGAQAAGSIGQVQVVRPGRALVIAMALAAIHLLVVPPLVVRPAETIELVRTGLTGLAANPRNGYLAVTILVGLAAMAGWGRSLTGGRASRVLTAACLWMAVVNGSAEARVTLATADRSPLRPLEEHGFTLAADWVNQHAAPGDVVVSPKDIGVRQAVRYYALDSLRMDEFTEILRRPEVRFVVDSDAFPLVRDRAALERLGFTRVAVAGDFVIYGRVPTSTPTGQVTPVPPIPQ